jgi:LCP family protein required for cell wall assembly
MRKGKKRKKIVNYKRFAIVTFTFLVMVALIGFGYFYFYLLGFNNSAVDLSKKDLVLNKDAVEKIKNDGKSCNILVMGVDVGDANSKSANVRKRTDTMILAHYNSENKKVDLISIPRDTLISINGRNQKINAAHAIGGTNGVKYAVTAVEELLGVSIDYYGKIDYEGFRGVIDAIGGLDMEITRRMDYDDGTQNLSIHFEKGTTVHLDGKKAEEFFRWRQNNDGSGGLNGDLGRIENQHMFIGKVMDKIKSPSIVIKIPSILSSIQSNVETNMDANEILKYGWIFAQVGNADFSMDTINGDLKNIDNSSYLVYDDDKNQEIISRLYDSDVRSFDKSKFKIQVLNGTKKVGLASDYSTYITKIGYKEVVTDNGEAASTSKILVYNGDESIKDDLIKDFKIDNIQFLSSTEKKFDIIVILGEDHEFIY